MAKVRITWEVDDGYAGKSRPQFTELTADEAIDYIEAETPEEQQTIAEQAVEDDYINRITWYIKNIEVQD